MRSYFHMHRAGLPLSPFSHILGVASRRKEWERGKGNSGLLDPDEAGICDPCGLLPSWLFCAIEGSSVLCSSPPLPIFHLRPRLTFLCLALLFLRILLPSWDPDLPFQPSMPPILKHLFCASGDPIACFPIAPRWTPDPRSLTSLKSPCWPLFHIFLALLCFLLLPCS